MTPCMFSDMYHFSLDPTASEDQIAFVIEKYVSNKPFALPADLIVRQMHLEDFEIWRRILQANSEKLWTCCQTGHFTFDINYTEKGAGLNVKQLNRTRKINSNDTLLFADKLTTIHKYF